jgi:hypothetical protein
VSQEMERPLFVIGVHRSGTTLLRYMLSSHPRIYIPPESDFIPRFFGRHPTARMNRQAATHILRTIFESYRFVREWQGPPPEPGSFVDHLPDLTPAAFLDTLYQHYAKQHGAERWGDKTPIYTSYMDLLLQIFPSAQFIHIIRDGRDVALSMIDKWGAQKGHIDLYFAAHTWQRRLRQALESASRLGSDQYMELRYEALVHDPEPYVRAMCAFVGESYVPEMTEPHRLGQRRIEPGSFHAAVREPPSPDQVSRWRREMSLSDQRICRVVAGEMLQELGYETPELGDMTAAERSRLAGLAAKYAVLQTGRTVLQALGLFHPN